MRLEDAHAGLAVVYTPKHGRREDGVVTGKNGTFVFVRFTGQHPDAAGQACLPWDLAALTGPEAA